MAKCPFSRKACMENECELYIQVLGQHPQTGETVDKWGCSLSWMPALLIENSNEQRKTAASIQSFRNEVIKENNKFNKAMEKVAAEAELLDYGGLGSK